MRKINIVAIFDDENAKKKNYGWQVLIIFFQHFQKYLVPPKGMFGQTCSIQNGRESPDQ